MVSVKAKGKRWIRAFNKINQKSVDFVLVDNNTFETKLVIELDDLTHLKPARHKRDRFVDRILALGEIPILHTNTQTVDAVEVRLKE